MWRPLSVTRGDIVMFADADTRDFVEHFIYGTLGPLLMVPGAGSARRPTGARSPVTIDPSPTAAPGPRADGEPLLNLFFPGSPGSSSRLPAAAVSGPAPAHPVPDRVRDGDRDP